MDTPPYNDQKGKLTRAMDLVLTGKVQAHADGLYSVQGSSKVYEIDGECPCPQGQRAASKYCYHLVAVELWKRANERLYAGNGNGHTWVDAARANPPVTGAAAGAQVAADTPASRHWTDHEPPVVWHVEFVVDGVKHGVTVRCDDLQEAKAQVKEITALVKKAQSSETPSQVEDIPYCNTHNVYFERHSNAKGSWFSHKTAAEGWCRYQGKK